MFLVHFHFRSLGEIMRNAWKEAFPYLAISLSLTTTLLLNTLAQEPTSSIRSVASCMPRIRTLHPQSGGRWACHASPSYMKIVSVICGKLSHNSKLTLGRAFVDVRPTYVRCQLDYDAHMALRRYLCAIVLATNTDI